MKSVLKNTGKALLFLLLLGICTAVLCTLAFIIYAARADGLSASALESRARGQDRTTRLYCLKSCGSGTDGSYAVELEGEELYASENREWVDISRIPDGLINAFVCIEDHRFFEHEGIDLRRSAGAVLGFLTGKSSYGGSTITQQLVKNVSGDNSVTVRRKIREMIQAYRLEKRLTKREILELYLNTIYLAENSYGVGVAAENYFGKDVSALTLAECASLACIPQSPSKWDPVLHPENNESRRRTVLSRMLKLGKISEEEYRAATEEKVTTVAKKDDEREFGARSWYTEAVIDDAIPLLISSGAASDEAEAKRLLYTGGLRIITAVDPDMQKAVEDYFSLPSNFYSATSGSHPECAMVVIDPSNGNVLALAGATGKKVAGRTTNYATGVTRSPGSAIKPLSVYAPALDAGIITYGSVFDDTPADFVKTDAGGTRGWPMNYPEGYRGLTTIRDAVSRSVNTVAVKVLHELGRERSFDFLTNKLRFSHLTEGKTENGRFMTDIADCPLALGQMTYGVTVRELTAGYTPLCSGGNYRESRVILKILGSDGTLLVDNSPPAERVISEESAYIMTRLLQNVTLVGTASSMTLKKDIECAGKTGTSGGDRDRWYVGYTPDLLAGVWFGYPDPESLEDYPTAPSPALRTWDNVMKEINTEKYLDRTPKSKFDEVPGIVTASYCRDSGKITTAVCGCDPRGGRTEVGYFTRNSVPEEYCDRHVPVDYDIVGHGVVLPGYTRAKTEAETETETKTDTETELKSETKTEIKKVGLLRLLRSFPQDVTISDAQFTYVPLPEGVPPCFISSEPFYLGVLPPGRSPGHSKTLYPFNRGATIKNE